MLTSFLANEGGRNMSKHIENKRFYSPPCERLNPKKETATAAAEHYYSAAAGQVFQGSPSACYSLIVASLWIPINLSWGVCKNPLWDP